MRARRCVPWRTGARWRRRRRRSSRVAAQALLHDWYAAGWLQLRRRRVAMNPSEVTDRRPGAAARADRLARRAPRSGARRPGLRPPHGAGAAPRPLARSTSRRSRRRSRCGNCCWGIEARASGCWSTTPPGWRPGRPACACCSGAFRTRWNCASPRARTRWARMPGVLVDDHAQPRTAGHADHQRRLWLHHKPHAQPLIAAFDRRWNAAGHNLPASPLGLA